MAKKKQWFSSAGSLLEGALGSVDQANLLNLARVTARWPRIVGEQMAVVSLPVRLKYRELTIHVTEPVWVDSLLYLKSIIIKKTNREVGKELVDSVRVVRKQFEPVVVPPPAVEPLPLPEETLCAIESMVANVADPELRSALKRVMLKSEQAHQGRSSRHDGEENT